MTKVFKIIGVILFMVAGYFVGDILFKKVLDPLQIGPRPLVAAITVCFTIPIFAGLGVIILKAENI